MYDEEAEQEEGGHWPGMEQETGARRTFVIHILNQQNATWQGTVTWLDGKQTRPFRCALELIRLMDGVIGQSESEVEPPGSADTGEG